MSGSPYLEQIFDCMKLIDDLEAEKKGTPDEKNLSTFDKYKIGVIFMQMLQDPSKFKHLDRFIATDDTKGVRMNLSDADIIKHQQLEEKIKENIWIKE